VTAIGNFLTPHTAHVGPARQRGGWSVRADSASSVSIRVRWITARCRRYAGYYGRHPAAATPWQPLPRYGSCCYYWRPSFTVCKSLTICK